MTSREKIGLPPIPVRDAEEGDLPAILAIYNQVIATSTAVYTSVPATLAERRAWLQARRGQDYPVLVAGQGGDVVGFASFGEFRSWSGYRHTVEHSVHVREDQRGQGAGRALMEALFPRAAALGKHVMIGGVDAENAASIRFHERLGFERVAHFRQVGRKFDRWLDLVCLQRFVDGG